MHHEERAASHSDKRIDDPMDRQQEAVARGHRVTLVSKATAGDQGRRQEVVIWHIDKDSVQLSRAAVDGKSCHNNQQGFHGCAEISKWTSVVTCFFPLVTPIRKRGILVPASHVLVFKSTISSFSPASFYDGIVATLAHLVSLFDLLLF